MHTKEEEETKTIIKVTVLTYHVLHWKQLLKKFLALHPLYFSLLIQRERERYFPTQHASLPSMHTPNHQPLSLRLFTIGPNARSTLEFQARIKYRLCEALRTPSICFIVANIKTRKSYLYLHLFQYTCPISFSMQLIVID